MKNKIALLLCLGTILLVLLFRSEVYNLASHAPRTSNQQHQDKTFADRLVVHFHDRRPYYHRVDNEVHGLVADQINLVFKAADLAISWVETPASRQLDIIRENRSPACAAGWFKNPERESYARFTLPIYRDRPFVGVTRHDNDLLGETDQLTRIFQERRLKLLVKSGYSYGAYIDSLIEKLQPWRAVTTSDNRGMLQMIELQRADYCFMSEEEAYDLLRYTGFRLSDYKLVHFSDVPEGNLRYIICSKKVPETTIARIDDAIRAMIDMKE